MCGLRGRRGRYGVRRTEPRWVQLPDVMRRSVVVFDSAMPLFRASSCATFRSLQARTSLLRHEPGEQPHGRRANPRRWSPALHLQAAQSRHAETGIGPADQRVDPNPRSCRQDAAPFWGGRGPRRRSERRSAAHAAMLRSAGRVAPYRFGSGAGDHDVIALRTTAQPVHRPRAMR